MIRRNDRMEKEVTATTKKKFKKKRKFFSSFRFRLVSILLVSVSFLLFWNNDLVLRDDVRRVERVVGRRVCVCGLIFLFFFWKKTKRKQEREKPKMYKKRKLNNRIHRICCSARRHRAVQAHKHTHTHTHTQVTKKEYVTYVRFDISTG